MVRRIFLVLDDMKYTKLLRLKGEKTWEKLLVDDLLEREEVKMTPIIRERGRANEA